MKQTVAQRKHKTQWILLLIILFVGIFGYLDFRSQHSVISYDEPREGNAKRLAIKQPMPNVILPLYDGNEVALESLTGKPILLHFWASWCVPCIKELPELFAMNKAVGDKVHLVMISNDSNAAAMETFLKKHKFWEAARQAGIVLALDAKRSISKKVFQTYKLPETILVNSKGDMVDKIIGADKKWSSAIEIEKILGL